MEIETEQHRNVSADDNDSIIPEPSSTKESLLEDISLSGQVMNPELSSAGEVLTKVEMDFHFVSEKLVNLSLLTMQLGAREHDFESFVAEREGLSSVGDDDDSAEKALEFDLLSSILNSEVKELESLLGYLQNEIQNACVMISPFQHDGEAFMDLEAKLHNAEQSLSQLMDQMMEMKKQSSNFQRLSSGLDEIGSWSGEQTAVSPNEGEFGDLNTKIKMQTADQQRNVLRMLEKSLAKEMELEKKLSESKNTEYELRMKIYSSEQDVVYMEQVIEDTYSRLLEAENASEVFKGMSKEMSGKLQILRFNLSGSFKREDTLKSELVGSMELLEAKESALYKLDSSNARLHDFLMAQTEGLKESLREAEEKMILLHTENSSLSEKVSSLEEQLNEYGIQTKDVDDTSAALINDLECLDDELKDNLAKTEARALEAESKCKTLEESNKELQDALGTFKAKGLKESLREAEEKMILLNTENSSLSEKVSSLEERLNEYGIQTKDVDDTSAALINDLECLDDKLKNKLVKAESRAEEAESKCKTLEESNKELQDALGTLKAKGFTLEKLTMLEKHLRDSELQLEHAVAAVEASKEKQNLLCSTVADMEDVIEDLKSKVLKAENRADHTEEKLITVSESNSELNEELKFFRGRLKEVEKYLQQAEERKLRTAKDIVVHNKIMKKLVMQLASERERLHKQMTNLSRENCVLMVKLKRIGKSGSMESCNGSKIDQNSRPQATVTSLTNPEEEERESKSDIGSVRRLDVGALGYYKHIVFAMSVIFTLLIAYFVVSQPNM